MDIVRTTGGAAAGWGMRVRLGVRLSALRETLRADVSTCGEERRSGQRLYIRICVKGSVFHQLVDHLYLFRFGSLGKFACRIGVEREVLKFLLVLHEEMVEALFAVGILFAHGE